MDGRYEGKSLNEAAIRRALTAARRDGLELVRGAYRGTTDDRADRWYWQSKESDTVDRRGPGFTTRSEAICAEFRVEAMRDPWRQ